MVDRNIFAAGTGLLLAAGSLTSPHVEAQSAQNGENTSPQREEIVITAQKRTEKLQDVPVSAVVLSNATGGTLVDVLLANVIRENTLHGTSKT
jgi:outer membrane receptor protein involved in Fe transport